MDRFRDAESPRGFAPLPQSGGLRHGKVQGLAQEPRIRSRTALIAKVQQKCPVRVGELRSAQTINVIFRRDPVKLEPLQLAPETTILRKGQPANRTQGPSASTASGFAEPLLRASGGLQRAQPS
jgi:hypothetical protein